MKASIPQTALEQTSQWIECPPFGLAIQEPPVADRGAVILATGVVVIAFVAGMLEVIQRLRGSRAWPVPLVIYLTLLPICLFFLISAMAVGVGLSPAYLAAVVIPLPLIFLAGRKQTA